MQNILLIFIVIFALAIGFFLGLFLLSLNTPLTRKLTRKEEPGSDAEGSADPGEGAPSASAQAPPLRKPSPDAKLIMQIWKSEGKPPIYDLDGEYLEKEQLPREILNVITIQDADSPQPKPEKAPPVPEKAPAVEAVEIEEEDSGEEIKMLSVIDEVNDILQKKLVGSPLAGKGIHLMENYNKEIRFWVGLNSYNDVEEIPDPEIRQIINDSVREWERSRE
jgi:hypothetical protein